MLRLLLKARNCFQESKKWQERKDALDCLDKLSSNPKLESGQYGELCAVLKKVGCILKIRFICFNFSIAPFHKMGCNPECLIIPNIYVCIYAWNMLGRDISFGFSLHCGNFLLMQPSYACKKKKNLPSVEG